jgi:hypothetical protein
MTFRRGGFFLFLSRKGAETCLPQAGAKKLYSLGMTFRHAGLPLRLGVFARHNLFFFLLAKASAVGRPPRTDF